MVSKRARMRAPSSGSGECPWGKFRFAPDNVTPPGMASPRSWGIGLCVSVCILHRSSPHDFPDLGGARICAGNLDPVWICAKGSNLMGSCVDLCGYVVLCVICVVPAWICVVLCGIGAVPAWDLCGPCVDLRGAVWDVCVPCMDWRGPVCLCVALWIGVDWRGLAWACAARSSSW